MSNDPIVDEVRRAREDYAKKFNYDLDAIVRDVQQRQAAGGTRLVRRKPRLVQTSITVPSNDAESVVK